MNAVLYRFILPFAEGVYMLVFFASVFGVCVWMIEGQPALVSITRSSGVQVFLAAAAGISGLVRVALASKQ